MIFTMFSCIFIFHNFKYKKKMQIKNIIQLKMA